MIRLPRPQPVHAVPVGRRLHQLWDIALAYMPMLMLSVLLLISIWLVRNAPDSSPAEAPKPVSHTPDYEFSQFTLRSYGMNGRIVSAMKGDKAQHFQDTLNTLVQAPQVWVFSDKRLTIATAKQALTNEDGSQVQLMGRALIQRNGLTSPAKAEQITSDFLHFDANTDTLVTHLPVHMVRGEDRFYADSLRADNLNKVLQLKGRVKVSILPTTAP